MHATPVTIPSRISGPMPCRRRRGSAGARETPAPAQLASLPGRASRAAGRAGAFAAIRLQRSAAGDTCGDTDPTVRQGRQDTRSSRGRRAAAASQCPEAPRSPLPAPEGAAANLDAEQLPRCGGGPRGGCQRAARWSNSHIGSCSRSRPARGAAADVAPSGAQRARGA